MMMVNLRRESRYSKDLLETRMSIPISVFRVVCVIEKGKGGGYGIRNAIATIYCLNYR